MTEITIPRRGSAAGPLPPTCVDCGAPAGLIRREDFAWTPSWALACWLFGLLPGVLAVLASRRHVTIDLPVCDRHRARESGRPTAVWLALGIGLVAGIAGAALPSDPAGIGEILFMSGVGLMILAGLAALILGGRGVRAAWISDHEVRLAGVSEEFARAVVSGLAEIAPPMVLGLQTEKYMRGRM